MTFKGFIVLFILVAIIVTGGIIWAHNHNKKVAVETAVPPVMSVSAFNQTKNASASTVNASPNDVIVFTLTAENQTDKVISGYIMEASLADLSGGSTLTDANGASYNSATNSLVWTPLDIEPNQSIQKKITVRVNAPASGAHTGLLKIQFNNEVSINVADNTVANSGNNPGKVAGTQNNYQAPVTGASENITLGLAAFSTLGFWLIRRRKLAKI